MALCHSTAKCSFPGLGVRRSVHISLKSLWFPVFSVLGLLKYCLLGFLFVLLLRLCSSLLELQIREVLVLSIDT